MDKLKTQTLQLTCIPAVILALVLIAIIPCLVIDTRCQQIGHDLNLTADKPIEPAYIDTAEIDLVVRVVAAEARGEPLAGQMAVTQVICDRAELRGMTLTEIVSQPSQFAEPYEGEISDLTREAVQRVLIDGERVFSQPVTHFHSGNEKPYWARDMTMIAEVGGHKFYY